MDNVSRIDGTSRDTDSSRYSHIKDSASGRSEASVDSPLSEIQLKARIEVMAAQEWNIINYSSRLTHNTVCIIGSDTLSTVILTSCCSRVPHQPTRISWMSG